MYKTSRLQARAAVVIVGRPLVELPAEEGGVLVEAAWN